MQPNSRRTLSSSRWPLSAILLLISIAFLLIFTHANAAPHRHGHHKQKRVPAVVDDDYEYRDFNDYTSGVAIDYAKMSTTKKMMPDENKGTATTLRQNNDDEPFFQKTNRYPKSGGLSKFGSDDEQRRQWYEALFTQRRRK